ncbi:hypothetical protein P692DRAFT_201107518 [Suillus brevipes Sb2]|nr:hypothetical protein P692DRAFT_201107518 [Suillus brevipes Sb2]
MSQARPETHIFQSTAKCLPIANLCKSVITLVLRPEPVHQSQHNQIMAHFESSCEIVLCADVVECCPSEFGTLVSTPSNPITKVLIGDIRNL